MDLQQMIMTGMGFLITIIGFFLKRVIDDSDKTRDLAQRNQAKLELLESETNLKFNHIEQKMNELTIMIKELSNDIKAISIKLNQK